MQPERAIIMGSCVGKCIGGAAAYPGDKRVAKPVYQPGDDEYKQINSTTAVANAHFVTCPGGNALKLVGKPNRGAEAAPAAGGGLAKYISGECWERCIFIWISRAHCIAICAHLVLYQTTKRFALVSIQFVSHLIVGAHLAQLAFYLQSHKTNQ